MAGSKTTVGDDRVRRRLCKVGAEKEMTKRVAVVVVMGGCLSKCKGSCEDLPTISVVLYRLK